jgi:hypothetical protein
VSVVAGATREQVLDAFRADRSTETPATFEEAFNDFPSPTYLLLDEVPGGVLAVENNGWWGVDADVGTAASHGATLASYYKNVNAVMTFVHAEDGVLLTMFDPLLDDVPAALSTQAEGLPFGVEHAQSSAFALLERLTGIAFEESWLLARHGRFDVPSPV